MADDPSSVAGTEGARSLLNESMAGRWVLLRLFREAAAAAAWVGKTGRGHARWGDGSLMAAALRRKSVSEPTLASPDYCRCLAMTYAALGEAEI